MKSIDITEPQETKKDKYQAESDVNYSEKDTTSKTSTRSMLLLLLFMMMMINFGNIYAFDYPQLFEAQLLNQFDIKPLQVSYLYSIYSIPNFIFAPIISVILNYTGMGFGGILLSFLVTFSSFLMYAASKYNLFWLMMVARAIFGVGAESLIVAQASMAEKWYTGKFLTVALGLNQIFQLFGAASAAWLGPIIYVEKRDIDWVLFVIILTCFFSWLFSIFFWIYETILDEREKKTKKVAYDHYYKQTISINQDKHSYSR